MSFRLSRTTTNGQWQEYGWQEYSNGHGRGPTDGRVLQRITATADGWNRRYTSTLGNGGYYPFYGLAGRWPWPQYSCHPYSCHWPYSEDALRSVQTPAVCRWPLVADQAQPSLPAILLPVARGRRRWLPTSRLRFLSRSPRPTKDLCTERPQLLVFYRGSQSVRHQRLGAVVAPGARFGRNLSPRPLATEKTR